MAIWYTDNINGNDTTGDGSIALPYKTINKAMTVGTNGDEIRVAGSTFTALSGTVTATTVGATTWNTSVNQTGILNPGDIITVNDAEFGDQKFFYKVFSVGATSIVVDGAWNRTPNTTLTFSRIAVASQQYYTTTANVTFENVTIAGKTDFKITGGWTNSYTAQDGWTIMNYHSTATATAKSGTGFTSIQGGSTGSIYFDKFMLSHLNTGFGGSTNRWFIGTLAFVYLTTTSPFGAGGTTQHGFGTPDLYLTNSIFTNGLGAGIDQPNNAPQLQYGNVWYANTAATTNTSAIAFKATNYYARSNFATGIQSVGVLCSGYATVDNLYIATQNSLGFVENIVLFSPTAVAGGASYINGDIQISGPNTSATLVLSASPFTAINNQIKLNTKRIEDFTLVSNGYNGNNIFPTGNIIDIDGEKVIYSNSCIAYADSTEFSTGTNSLKLNKVTIANSIPARVPIESIYINNANAKTITIRAKASTSPMTVSFGLLTGKISLGSTNATLTPTMYKSQDFSLTTSWQDFTYTQLDASTAAFLLNSYAALVARVDNISGTVWIDSVTIS